MRRPASPSGARASGPRPWGPSEALAGALGEQVALDLGEQREQRGHDLDPDLLRHVSLIEWKNVILYGEIKIDPAKLKRRGP